MAQQTTSDTPEILDIRAHDEGSPNGRSGIRTQILDGLSQPTGQKTLPTLLLYNEAGLRLYDDITTEAPEYYLFPAEEEILNKHADDIVQIMHSRDDGELMMNEIVLELGAGALRKTSHILLGLSRLVNPTSTAAPITYYALDLEKRELERTLAQLSASEIGSKLQGKVDIKGLCATYDSGLQFVQDGGLGRVPDCSTSNPNSPIYREHYKLPERKREHSPGSGSTRSSHDTVATAPSTPDIAQAPLHILFLGSSLGNFSRNEGAEFLRDLPLRPGSGDTLLLGLDHDNDREKIELAYNDTKGYTKKFIMNGLQAAGQFLGDGTLFDQEKWDYFNRYNTESRRHEAYYKSKVAQSISVPESSGMKVSFEEGELVNMEVSHKFSERDVYTLFTEASLRPIQRWTDSASQYSLWLLERPAIVFPLLKSPSAPSSRSPFSAPTRESWTQLWALWDLITMRMIPPEMLFQKPIDLRHICLFYFGHIPTFLDIHLSRLLQEPHTEPENYKYIFERGIDPNVDDPTECHPHSEVPKKDEDWPKLHEILDFKSRVRARLMRLYDEMDSGKRQMNRKIGRVLFMTFEHEALHAETLLYMLMQRAGTGTIPPVGFTPPPWESLQKLWDAVPVPSNSTITLGPTSVTIGQDDPESEDLNPQLTNQVEGHDFGWDNEHPARQFHVEKFRIDLRPVTNGQFYEFYKSSKGNDDLEFPASWIEVNDEIEVRTLYGPIPLKIARHWPIVTSYNNLSKYAQVHGGRLPTDPELRVFYDQFDSGYAGGSNVGFRNWHPVPATTGGEKDGGRGHNGGVWEWTSTLFDRYEGFVASELYPGYSADFFDGHYQVVLGGSYGTIPRITDRRSVHNWYQRNYPYPWIGGRVAYDIKN